MRSTFSYVHCQFVIEEYGRLYSLRPYIGGLTVSRLIYNIILIVDTNGYKVCANISSFSA